MRRPANVDWVHRTLESMRKAMPDLALRTTFIVGYPGETEEEFDELIDFVRDTRFDRVGVFEFSHEPGTPSAALGDPIPSEVKRERRDRLMTLQQSISLGRNQQLVGRTLDVIVEGSGDGVAVGRSYRDAPEVDGLVVVDSEIAVGALTQVLITGAMTYDLSGTLPPGRR
jgi:ribosomal protein S12 methylthiotransferase